MLPPGEEAPREESQAAAAIGPFLALLRAADRSAEAASGLAQAYTSLPVEGRSALLSVLEEDAAEEGIEALSLHLLLFEVEGEESLRQRLGARLGELLWARRGDLAQLPAERRAALGALL